MLDLGNGWFWKHSSWKTGCETESREVSRSLPWTAIKTNNLLKCICKTTKRDIRILKKYYKNDFVFIIFPQWERFLRVARKPLIFCATTRSVLRPTLSVTISRTALMGLMKLTVVSDLSALMQPEQHRFYYIRKVTYWHWWRRGNTLFRALEEI